MSAVRAVYMRGGTSKGIFLHAQDVPPPGPELDDLLLRIMGSPDPMQIDGMGGTYSSTSKVIIVDRAAGEVTYRFGQVSVDHPLIDWAGNCGNLTAAVAPFAIDEGLVAVAGDSAEVRLRNVNTGVRVEATVELEGGRAKTTGDHAVAGVPGTGSPVLTRYLEPSGSVLGSLLPTGSPTIVLQAGGRSIEASIVDATHPYVFVRAADVGLTGAIADAPARNGDPELLRRMEEIRTAAAVRVTAAQPGDDASIVSPTVPRIVAIRPGDDGAMVGAIALSMGKVHRALPMTAALCIGAAARIEGTLVAELARTAASEITIRHPRGVSPVLVDIDQGTVRSLGVVRTARRLMEGRVHPSPR